MTSSYDFTDVGPYITRRVYVEKIRFSQKHFFFFIILLVIIIIIHLLQHHKFLHQILQL